MTISIDISNTVGQGSAIGANGSPVFEVEVVHPTRACKDVERHGVFLGFGKVVSGGPVNGYEVGFKFESIQGEPSEGIEPCDLCF
jgi:hypothetical protein